MREHFGRFLVDVGIKNQEIVVLDADVCVSTKTKYFKEFYPDRFIQVGIAEQNMIGIAAGLSTIGYIPLVSSFAVFVTKRALDQISVSIAYPNLNVKIIGGYSGLSAGKAGPTHQSIEDIAILRAIPNMVIISPGSIAQMKKALDCSIDYKGPVYIRAPRNELKEIHDLNYNFEIGKGYIVEDGSDLAIFTTGVVIQEVIAAVQTLKCKGYSIRVVHMPTIKPIDSNLIKSTIKDIKKILTVEDHNIIGGFGSAVCEVAAELGGIVNRLGITDTFCESASERDLLQKYGINSLKIAEVAEMLIVGD